MISPRSHLDAHLCAAVDKPESMGEKEVISAILSGSKIIVNRRFGQIFAISLKQSGFCCKVHDIGCTAKTFEKKTCL